MLYKLSRIHGTKIHTYIHTRTYVHTCIHTCIHTYVHTHTHTYGTLQTGAQIPYLLACWNTSKLPALCTYIYMYVCMYGHRHVCIHTSCPVCLTEQWAWIQEIIFESSNTLFFTNITFKARCDVIYKKTYKVIGTCIPSSGTTHPQMWPYKEYLTVHGVSPEVLMLGQQFTDSAGWCVIYFHIRFTKIWISPNSNIFSPKLECSVSNTSISKS